MDENQQALGTEVTPTPATDGAPEPKGESVNYGEVFKGLEKKMADDPHYNPTDEEWDAYERMQNGEKPEAENTEENGEEGKEEKPETAQVPEEILKKVGAKSIAELGPKIDGLLNSLKEFNDERGATGSKLKEFETQKTKLEGVLQSQHNLLAGVLMGDQKALEQAQAIMAQAGVKIEAKAKAMDFSQFGINPKDLEDAVDGPVIKGLVGHIQKLETRLNEALGKADEVVKTVTTKANQDSAWGGVVNEFAEVGDKFFAEQGLRASAVRTLMREWKDTGVMPEPLKPLQELAVFADSKGLGLEMAYKIREFDNLPARLNKNGKPPSAKPSVGLSAKQGATQNNSHREFSGAQLEKMWKTGEFPATWSKDGELDFTQIPDYAQAYFEELVR